MEAKERQSCLFGTATRETDLFDIHDEVKTPQNLKKVRTASVQEQ
jgi:hypothetical protein